MFEFGHDQAAGLRSAALPVSEVRVIPVVSLTRPAQAYELLCTLAAHLSALRQAVVIVDGSATEQPGQRPQPGAHLGLLQALQNPGIAGLEQAPQGAEWLVMPGALGLQTLLQTARVAGPEVALSRLMAPFAPGVCVLVFAPAAVQAGLFGGLGARALVPVLDRTQSTLDTYGALKRLQQGDVTPVLVPWADGVGQSSVPLQQVVDTVTDCAQRHLGVAVDTWPQASWGRRAQVCALIATATGATREPAPTGWPTRLVAPTHATVPQWS
jgi:hypothetical protein